MLLPMMKRYCIAQLKKCCILMSASLIDDMANFMRKQKCFSFEREQVSNHRLLFVYGVVRAKCPTSFLEPPENLRYQAGRFFK